MSADYEEAKTTCHVFRKEEIMLLVKQKLKSLLYTKNLIVDLIFIYGKM